MYPKFINSQNTLWRRYRVIIIVSPERYKFPGRIRDEVNSVWTWGQLNDPGGIQCEQKTEPSNNESHCNAGIYYERRRRY